MTQRVRVLTIAGVDPCGGAGLTADARSIQASAGDAVTVPTCWTDQDRTGFRSATAIEQTGFEAMLAAALADAPVAACKTGMFASAETVASCARLLAPHRLPLVVDPVLSATAGGGQQGAARIASALRAQLVPLATVVTPNRGELRAIAPEGPSALLELGARAVLVTGGDGEDEEVVDELWTEGGHASIRHPRVPIGPVHGTGCALSSVLAVELARGATVEAACRTAVARVAGWIAATPPSEDGRPVPIRIGGC